MLNVKDIPKEALSIIYSEKMKEYESLNGKRDDIMQRDLSIMWKCLREGANSQYYDFFEARGIPRESIQQANPKDLERLKKSIEQADKAIKELTPEPPEWITDPDGVEKSVREKIKSDREKIKEQAGLSQAEFAKKMKSVLTPKSEKLHVPKELIPETSEPIEEAVLLEPESVTIQDEDIPTPIIDMTTHEGIKQEKPTHSTIETDKLFEEQKPKKKLGGGFFKKKVKKKVIKKGLPDKPLKNIDEKPNHRSIVKILQKKQKEGYDLKDNEMICECGHYLKSHLKKGKNMGCGKCACMNTVEEIASKHGEELKTFGQTKPEPEPEIIVAQEIEPNIAKQAKQIESMKPKNPTSISVKEEDENQFVEKEEQCICDHPKAKHYENRFCFNCDCSKFTPYRNEEKN